MRKGAMVQRMAAARGGTIGQADAAVEAVLATRTEALQQGEPVLLHRCGTWQVRAKRARVGRNPKTGAAAAIPARRVVCFVVSRTLQQAVAGTMPSSDAGDTARRLPTLTDVSAPRQAHRGRPTAGGASSQRTQG